MGNAENIVKMASYNAEKSKRAHEERDEDGVRVLSRAKLIEAIHEICSSKSKFDKKCSEGKLARETMEQHLYTFLYQKYGLRSLMIDWASAIIKGIKAYQAEDIWVGAFGKILRNELNEDFRFVLQELEREIDRLIVDYLRAKNALKSDAYNMRLSKRFRESEIPMDHGMWVDIIKHLYDDDDALKVISQVLESCASNTEGEEEPEEEAAPRAAALAQMKPQGSGMQRSIFGKESPQTMDIWHDDLVAEVLGCQLQAQQRYLGKFLQLFRRFDSDRNGILNEQEFRQLLSSLGSRSEKELFQCVKSVDPHNHQSISFSECVNTLADEIAAMSS